MYSLLGEMYSQQPSTSNRKNRKRRTRDELQGEKERAATERLVAETKERKERKERADQASGGTNLSRTTTYSEWEQQALLVILPWRHHEATMGETIALLGSLILNSAGRSAGRWCIQHARQFVLENPGWYLDGWYLEQAERTSHTTDLRRMDSQAISQAHPIRQLCKAPGQGGSAIAGLVVQYLARNKYYGTDKPRGQHQTPKLDTVLAECLSIVGALHTIELPEKRERDSHTHKTHTQLAHAHNLLTFTRGVSGNNPNNPRGPNRGP